jgi:uncharacterized membrane protein YphA (DoxX/SURF4 family)
MMAWIFLLLRLACGSVFIYSGWNKLVRPVEEFQFVIESYRSFPSLVIPSIAYSLPWVEIVCGTFLFLGYLRVASARLLALLTAGFLILLTSAYLRGIDLSHCGCFGEGIHLTPVQAITFDCCLLVALTLVSISKLKAASLDAFLLKDPA